jgi:oxygen-independent coproporphyrinogen III oxidase
MSNHLEPPWIWPRAAYVHVPFCAHHCGYCDFAIAVNQDAEIDHYVQALGLELEQLNKPQQVETLFLGGGTPTHLDSRQLAAMLDSILHWLPGAQEFSIEANPSTLSADKIAVLAEHGVNRLSLGVQSFDGGILRVLERDHRPEDVSQGLLARIRRHIPQVSLDLIFGVPGQTLEEWQGDLRRALSLEPDHIATYGLTYEKGTPLWKQRQRGQVRALDEETELAMYTAAMDVLESAGFEHYELSNFARPGRRCRHNQVYWANHAHFGFGMGAARYVRGVRELNTRDLGTYLKRVLAGRAPTFQSECLEPRARALETVAVQLRRSDGIDRTAFETQTGFALDELVRDPLSYLTELGLLDDNDQSVRLSRSGKCVADAVIAELFQAQKSGEGF